MLKINLRDKIVLYFSSAVIILTGVAFILVYLFFSQYRKEEFYQRLEDTAETTYKFLIEVDQIDKNLLLLMNKNTINKLYEEVILVFDQDKKLIFSSVDDTRIVFTKNILEELNTENPIVMESIDQFEVFGLYSSQDGESFYTVVKAYDRYGRSKLSYLKWLLMVVFVIVIVVILLVSLFLSKQISAPLNRITKSISKIKIENLNHAIEVPKSGDEIEVMAVNFNKMLERINSSVKFQSHFIQHISHELKTPIAVLLSNIERIKPTDNWTKIEKSIQHQKSGLIELANIINSLLEISKTETLTENQLRDKIRVDELIFEVLEELSALANFRQFDFELDENITDEESLIIKGNRQLLKSCFLNLVRNSVFYSDKKPPLIFIKSHNKGVQIVFQNDGQIVSEKEQAFLFEQFFRGNNSRHKNGFGVGLVFVKRILRLHNGLVSY